VLQMGRDPDLRRKRSLPREAASSGRRTLIATGRLWRESRARYTVAMPP
jgi:hypothetical protein